MSRRLGPFLASVLVATLFHVSALCYLLAWPLARISLKRRHVWLVIGALVAFSFVGGGAILVQLAASGLHIPLLDKKLKFYAAVSTQDLGAAAHHLTLLWYLERTAFLVFFAALLPKFTTPAERFYFNMYLFSLALFVIFVAIIPMIPLRAGLYFSVFDIFLFVSLIDKIQRPWLRQLYCIALILLAAARLYSSLYTYEPHLYLPYKGVFINTDFYRGMY